MASAEQIKALLKSHIDGEDDRFFSVAMQVAAHEARLGHGKLAAELRSMIDDAKGRRDAGPPVPIGRPRGELANLLEASWPKARLSEMILQRRARRPDSEGHPGAAPCWVESSSTACRRGASCC